MAKNRHILHAAARRRGNSSRVAVLIAALAVLAGATAAVQPAQAQTTVNICDRTPEVETAIRNSPGVTETDCTVVPSSQLLTVTRIILQGQGLSGALQVDDFANLTNLTNLDLGINALTSVPADVFDGLSNLTRLNLGTNELDSLPAGIFDGLFALTTLHLDRNPLNNPPLPAGIFNDVLGRLATFTFDEVLRTTVSIGPSAAVIMPNSTYRLTARLTLPSPATVRLTITADDVNTGRSIILPNPATVTIPAGMTSADFDIALPVGAVVGGTGAVSLSAPALLYTDTNDDVRENTDVVDSLVNRLNTENNTFAFSVSNQPGATVNICDRTPRVEAAILAAARVNEADCADVPQASLDTVNELNLRSAGLTTLQSGDFANLPNLRTLVLNFNNLTSLPDGIFNDVLDTLTLLTLDDALKATVSIGPSAAVITPNSNYRLTARLTPPSPATVRLTITAGGDEATSRVTLPNPATVTIPAGMTSVNFDITLTGAAVGNAGTVSLSARALLYTDTNGEVQENTDVVGSLVNRSSTATSTFAFSVDTQPGAIVNICDRTPEVEAAILVVTRANCAMVPQASLDTVNELNLVRASLTTLQSGDFANLPNLRTLRLNSNNLASLPVGLFNDVLDTLTTLTLDDALKAEASIEPRTVTIITLNAIQTFTAQLTSPLPATVRLDITASGAAAENVTFPDPATVTIPAGMTSATFDITLTGATPGDTGIIILSAPALIYTDTSGEEQRSIVVVNSLVNISGTAISSSSTFTVSETPLVATLTRNSASTEEGASPTPGIFTLALSNAPDGLSTVTYTLAVSGDNAKPADISAELGGGASGIPETSGASDIFTMTATDGDASATLTITPEDDDDATDEVVTLTIISIELARISIGPNSIQGADVSNGALAITISDDDPAATYFLEDSRASEPTSSTATDASTATFTITLSRLNTAQMDSPNRRFFFRVAPNGIGNGNLRTPGYGSSLPMGIDSNSLASNTDFNLSLEYQLEDGLSVVAFTFHDNGTARETFSSNVPIPKAVGDTDEVYRFHIIPTHDDDDEEGAEHVLFGYRVHFPDQDSHRLTGVVNGSTTTPAATIRDDAAVRLRIRTFLEGALQ